MKKYDVLAIGNAILDIVCKVEDNFLTKNDIAKGAMTLVDEDRAKTLYAQVKNSRQISGGSAANTLAGIANIGGKCAFIGKVRNDQLGEIFRHDLTSLGINFTTENSFTGPATARCYVFVTPDAQRSMCTYLGAANKIEKTDIDKDKIKESGILYIEGYMWDLPESIAAIEEAVTFARSHDIKIAFTLSDEFCVNRFREEFLEFVQKKVDILFANESEIKSLFMEPDSFENAKQKLRNLISTRDIIAAVTRSEKGAVIFAADDFEHVQPAEEIEELVDTTGAGDLFAAGFLYGLSQNKKLNECAKLANEQAAKVIQQLGARIFDN